jgi:hypothetical protein
LQKEISALESHPSKKMKVNDKKHDQENQNIQFNNTSTGFPVSG